MPDVSKYKDQFKTPAFAHQLFGIEQLVNKANYGLFDEMGAGKSKQVIDAACILFKERRIDAVLVVAPASVRGVWLNPDFGELVKHCWVPFGAYEFHAKGLRAKAVSSEATDNHLFFVVTNYEYIRSEKNRKQLLKLLGDSKFMMVLDESSYIKNREAKQTKACMEVGEKATKRVILNGTPITNSPMDLWPQMRFLSPTILPFRNWYAFRARYAINVSPMAPFPTWKYVNLDELQEKVKPHVIRREKKDCLDLPPKIFSQMEVPLDPENWERYQQMRDECIVWLDENPSMALQAGVKVMRLAQITSGFLGGFENDPNDTVDGGVYRTEELGREKLDLFKDWVHHRIQEGPLKVITWCRFRHQLNKVYEELEEYLPVFKLQGGQTRDERDKSIAAFSVIDNKSGLLAAQQQAGSFGLNLIGADKFIYMSNDFNLAVRLQSEDRGHRPGQTRTCWYGDVLATGPKGEKTIDHGVLLRLKAKQDLATWTTSAWKQMLRAV